MKRSRESSQEANMKQASQQLMRIFHDVATGELGGCLRLILHLIDCKAIGFDFLDSLAFQ